MQDYFGEALSDFVKNFAWGGCIEHLLENGYSIEQMIKEERVRLSKNQIEELCIKINRHRIQQGKEPYKYE